jgi:hypothetical protein
LDIPPASRFEVVKSGCGAPTNRFSAGIKTATNINASTANRRGFALSDNPAHLKPRQWQTARPDLSNIALKGKKGNRTLQCVFLPPSNLNHSSSTSGRLLFRTAAASNHIWWFWANPMVRFPAAVPKLIGLFFSFFGAPSYFE